MKKKRHIQLNFTRRCIDMKKNVELCIRDREGRIVAWQAGYSDEDLKNLLEHHKDEDWHTSYAEYTENGLR